jgi:hypothetical protein
LIIRLFLPRIASRVPPRPLFLHGDLAPKNFLISSPAIPENSALREGAIDAGEAPEIFQYSFRTTPENSAPRAKTPKFIGSGTRDFRCGGVYVEQFGLRIMNPPP